MNPLSQASNELYKAAKDVLLQLKNRKPFDYTRLENAIDVYEQKNEQYEEIQSKSIQKREPKQRYAGNKLAGDIAKEVGYPIGELGCPNCGSTQCGAFYENKCEVCDKPFWSLPNKPENK